MKKNWGDFKDVEKQHALKRRRRQLWRAPTGWTEEMEAAVTSSYILPEHRALLGTVCQHFWSVEIGMKEALKGLFKGFEVRRTWFFVSSLKIPGFLVNI
jgi:hypothetical protein